MGHILHFRPFAPKPERPVGSPESRENHFQIPRVFTFSNIFTTKKLAVEILTNKKLVVEIFYKQKTSNRTKYDQHKCQNINRNQILADF